MKLRFPLIAAAAVALRPPPPAARTAPPSGRGGAFLSARSGQNAPRSVRRNAARAQITALRSGA